MTQGNLFAELPPPREAEHFDTLAQTPGLRIERIVSSGQCTPPGQWYDQPRAEWVVLLQGAAELRFEDEPAPRRLGPGDWVFIPAHRRHRVTWTDPGATSVWLAVHWDEG